MGFPLGAGLSLFFIGMEQGPSFAATSALWSVQGIVATLGFCLGYLAGIQRSGNSKITSLFLCTFLGVTGFLATAFCIRYLLPDIIWLRSLILATVVTVCAVKFRKIPAYRIEKRALFTPLSLAGRAGFASVVILLVTGMAQIIGPQWSGLFSTFPTTVLPSVLVLHYSYGPRSVQAVFREFPFGLLAIVVFALAVSQSYPSFGTGMGTVISYMLATLYLLFYELKLRQMLDARL
jgi:hypothetical protein